MKHITHAMYIGVRRIRYLLIKENIIVLIKVKKKHLILKILLDY